MGIYSVLCPTPSLHIITIVNSETRPVALKCDDSPSKQMEEPGNQNQTHWRLGNNFSTTFEDRELVKVSLHRHVSYAPLFYCRGVPFWHPTFCSLR